MAGNLVNNNGVTNTFNDANQLTGDGTDTFDYDDNGSLWKTNSVVSHTWDRANRLLSHGGLDYAYDGLGNRISQDNGSTVTQYLLDLQAGLPRVLSETVGANVTQFVYSPRGLHATQNSNSNWFWGLQDGLGSQRAEVDGSGAVGASQDFTPYGVVQNVTGSFNSPHAFTGEPVDANGLQYHRARYYDPAMGVWASLDPFEGKTCTPMSLNRYGYVEGNVSNLIDSSGNIGELPNHYAGCVSSPSVGDDVDLHLALGYTVFLNPPEYRIHYEGFVQNLKDSLNTEYVIHWETWSDPDKFPDKKPLIGKEEFNRDWPENYRIPYSKVVNDPRLTQIHFDLESIYEWHSSALDFGSFSEYLDWLKQRMFFFPPAGSDSYCDWAKVDYNFGCTSEEQCWTVTEWEICYFIREDKPLLNKVQFYETGSTHLVPIDNPFRVEGALA